MEEFFYSYSLSEEPIITSRVVESALRGAATLRQRTVKDTRHSVATVMPYERSSELRPSPSSDRCITCHSSTAGYSGDYGADGDSEIDYSAHEILARGTEFLKRTRNGE